MINFNKNSHISTFDWLIEKGGYIINYEQFLLENKILPIDCENGRWNHFKIDNVSPQGEVTKTTVKRYIENNVGDRNGLYIYKDDKGDVLYIGKGKPLKNRLFSHYLESFQPVKGDSKDQRWHKFFQKHQGTVDVFWLELETEKERQLIEKMLDYLLDPLFSKPVTTLIPSNEKQNFNPTPKDVVDSNKTFTYKFYHYGEELIEKVHVLLGSEFNPKYNKTGITFYRGEKRILKLVNLMNALKVEFNVPVAKVEGLTTLTKEEAKGNKMGTCQWIYKGKSLDTAMTLIEEAKEVYLQKH